MPAHRDFSGGLDLARPQDEMLPGTLRRSTGLHAVDTKSARSRDGCVLLYTRDAHSLMVFDGDYFVGAGTALYRNDVAIKAGLSGERLAFVRMAPTEGKDDWLFVAGGGELFKVAIAGTVSKWGIAAPADGFTATAQARREKAIETFDDHATWTVDGLTKANDADNRQEGDAALKLTVVADATGRAWKTVATADLTAVGVDPSPDEDFITFWVQIDEPNALDSVELAFKLGAASFDAAGDTADAYTIRLTPGEMELRVYGIASFLDEDSVADSNKVVDERTEIVPGVRVPARRTMSTAAVPNKRGSWGHVRIAKADFERSGASTDDWADVTGLRVTVSTNAAGAVNVWLDDLRLAGGVGMQGAYKYRVTFYNSVTGHRSNPNPTPVVVEDIDRNGILLAALPVVSTDPQVDTVEIWRTLGDGARSFRAGSVPLGTATFLDEVADYIGLHGDAGAYLESIELDVWHAPPDATYNDTAGPFQGCAWWTRDSATGAGGRVYYSQPGLPETVKGYINVTEVDDPVVRLVIWQGGLYAFSRSRIFEIVGTGEPFTYREMFGCPGTSSPFSVAATPVGIVYEAADGLRVFDGAHSSSAFASAVNPIFRGDSVGSMLATTVVCAAYARGELFLGLNGDALAYNGVRWRALGRALNVIHFDDERDDILTSYGGQVVRWEVEGALDDAGDAIPFELETPAVRAPAASEGLQRRVFIDIDTAGEAVVPTLVYDIGEFVLPAIFTAGRHVVEYARLDRARTCAVRLTGAVRNRVTVYGIEFDPYVGE